MENGWKLERAAVLQAFSEQCAYFRGNGFIKAEKLSAENLFVSCSEVLRHVSELYPNEKKTIRKARMLMRRTRKKYRDSLDYSMVGSKKNYDRLAHPVKTKLKKKAKNAKIRFRRIVHG